MEADDDGLYVVKFRGAGQGPKALAAEIVAGELARALGLPVPELVLVELDPALGAAEPDPEIQELIAASAGLNLGVDYLPGSLPLFVPTEQEGVLGVLDPEVLRHRWLAVSATALTAYFRPVLGWLRAYCPVGNLGGTIMLYRFNRPPDYDAHGPDRPAAPCDGGVSHR